MKELKITFSFRDWQKGQRILQMLGLIPEDRWLISDSWEIKLEDEDHLHELESELDSVDCEFVIKEV